MPPNPDPAAEPLLEVIEDLALPHLHAAAWATCRDGGWRFGHGSNAGEARYFWTLDLNGDAAFDAIWQQARAKCERLAGARLRVIRQYANGHTYGLGGSPHVDDDRPGTYTLLYYPMAEWKADWDGETCFYDGKGEIAFAVQARPNRAVFFDSRIPHNGRAPSRSCPALRVTVAYKLETIPDAALPAEDTALTGSVAGLPGVELQETRRDAEKLELRVHVDAAKIEADVATALEALGRSVSLPADTAGGTPSAAIASRYGAQARHDILRRIAATLIDLHLNARGTIVAECELLPETASGGADFRVAATDLTVLPPFTFTDWRIEIPIPGAGITPADAAPGGAVREKILDWMDAAYRYPILPSLVERELAGLLRTPEIAAIARDGEGAEALRDELRALAERRLRLGFLVLEIARRLGLSGGDGAALEDAVIAHILTQARFGVGAAPETDPRETPS